MLVRLIAAVVVSATLVIGAAVASPEVGRWRREHEVRSALHAGLAHDCMIAFARFESDPDMKQYGHRRIFVGSEEFASLPDSIREFKPVYVVFEDKPFGSDMPRNIGLCKNGFGGFAIGVRVFLTDEEPPETLWKKRVAPGVYLWQQET